MGNVRGIMQVLVVGATGETGRRIVSALQTRGLNVRATVRDRARAEAMLPAGTELVELDLLQSDAVQQLQTALTGCQALVCATGARPNLNPIGPMQVDYLGTLNLIKAAKAVNLEQFVLVSSLCVSRFFHPLNLFFLILFWKKQAEAALISSGLPYTIVRPGGLKNEPSEAGLVINSADTLFEGSIPRDRVAEVCADALLLPAAKNRILEIVTKPDRNDSSLASWLANAI